MLWSNSSLRWCASARKRWAQRGTQYASEDSAGEWRGWQAQPAGSQRCNFEEPVLGCIQFHCTCRSVSKCINYTIWVVHCIMMHFKHPKIWINLHFCDKCADTVTKLSSHMGPNVQQLRHSLQRIVEETQNCKVQECPLRPSFQALDTEEEEQKQTSAEWVSLFCFER